MGATSWLRAVRGTRSSHSAPIVGPVASSARPPMSASRPTIEPLTPIRPRRRPRPAARVRCRALVTHRHHDLVVEVLHQHPRRRVLADVAAHVDAGTRPRPQRPRSTTGARSSTGLPGRSAIAHRRPPARPRPGRPARVAARAPRAERSGRRTAAAPQGGLLLGGEPAQVGEVGVLAGPPLHQRQDLQHPSCTARASRARSSSAACSRSAGRAGLGQAAQCRCHRAHGSSRHDQQEDVGRGVERGVGAHEELEGGDASAPPAAPATTRDRRTPARTAPITHSDGRLGPPLLHISSPWVRNVIRKSRPRPPRRGRRTTPGGRGAAPRRRRRRASRQPSPTSPTQARSGRAIRSRRSQLTYTA